MIKVSQTIDFSIYCLLSDYLELNKFIHDLNNVDIDGDFNRVHVRLAVFNDKYLTIKKIEGDILFYVDIGDFINNHIAIYDLFWFFDNPMQFSIWIIRNSTNFDLKLDAFKWLTYNHSDSEYYKIVKKTIENELDDDLVNYLKASM